MTIDLAQIIEAVLALLAALVTYKVVPWIKAKTTNEQQQRIATAVDIAVFAAEQLFGDGHGEEKLEYAQTWLEEKGFTVSRADIEAAVYRNINLISSSFRRVESGTDEEEIDG